MVEQEDAGSMWFDEALDAHPVMAILRGYDTARALTLAHRAWDLGVRLVEVPIQTAAAVQTLSAVAVAADKRGRCVGAGTVVRPGQVTEARAAGAAFTISPGFDADTVRASLAAGLPTMPGIATASDLQAALRLGLRWVKAFPAAALGVDWFRFMRGPFPQVRIVATGGIDGHNAAAFLAAGADAVGVGSALEDAGQLDLLGALSRPR
jgi:Entner-Doudoroff aldolase